MFTSKDDDIMGTFIGVREGGQGGTCPRLEIIQANLKHIRANLIMKTFL